MTKRFSLLFLVLLPWKPWGRMAFIRSSTKKKWDVVGSSMCTLIKNVFGGQPLPINMNVIFLCLIPKIDNPELVKHFRPISLCNTSYKVLSKVIMYRIRPFMHHLISPFQASFILGRRVVDNVVILREALLALDKNRRVIWVLWLLNLTLRKHMID